jgi:hypothetical protein
MAGKREMYTRDRQKNSAARKRTVKELKATQQQQSEVLQRLWAQAKVAAKA